MPRRSGRRQASANSAETAHSKQQNAAYKKVALQISEIVPQVELGLISAAVFQEDGNMERALNHVLANAETMANAEVQIEPVEPKTQENGTSSHTNDSNEDEEKVRYIMDVTKISREIAVETLELAKGSLDDAVLHLIERKLGIYSDGDVEGKGKGKDPMGVGGGFEEKEEEEEEEDDDDWEELEDEGEEEEDFLMGEEDQEDVDDEIDGFVQVNETLGDNIGGMGVILRSREEEEAAKDSVSEERASQFIESDFLHNSPTPSGQIQMTMTMSSFDSPSELVARQLILDDFAAIDRGEIGMISDRDRPREMEQVGMSEVERRKRQKEKEPAAGRVISKKERRRLKAEKQVGKK